MAWVKHGTLLSPGATGNQQTTIPDVGTEVPKVVLFFATRQIADGFAAGSMLGVGVAASSTKRKSAAVAADDNAGTSNTGRRYADLAITVLAGGAPTVAVEADFVSADAGAFTLNWTVVSGLTSYVIHWVAIGGDDITDVDVGQFDSATVTGNQDITTLPFEPDALIAFGIGSTSAAPTLQVNAILSFGAATGASERACACFRNREAVGTTELTRWQSTSRIYINPGNSGVAADADFVAFLSNGFRWNWITAPGTAEKICYVALRGTARFKVGAETQKTSTGTKATTGVGVGTVKGLLTWSAGLTAGASYDVNAGMFMFGMAGGSDSGQQGALWTGGADNAGTSDENQSMIGGKTIRFATSPSTIDADASTDSLDSDGMTLNYDVADAVARQFFYLAIGSAPVLTLSLAGAISPAGGLAKLTGKSVAGAIAPAGDMVKLAAKLVAGAVAPAGALAKLTSNVLGGSVSPAGALAKLTGKPLGGSVSPAGALQTAKVILLALAGSITPSGALGRQAQKLLSGSVTPSGGISKAVSIVVGGVLAPLGSLAKLVAKPFAGGISPAGVVTPLVTGFREALRFTVGRIVRGWQARMGGRHWDTGAPERGWQSESITRDWDADEPDSGWETRPPKR